MTLPTARRPPFTTPGYIELLPALAPDPANTKFPYPSLIQTGEPGLEYITYEGPIICGQPMPGQWLLTSAERTYSWQKQQQAFMGGANLVGAGIPLASIEYSIAIWESGAAGFYRVLLSTLFAQGAVTVPGSAKGTSTIAQAPASAAAMGIQDPALKDLGITTVVLEGITPLFNPLVSSGGKGPWTAKAKFVEYRIPFQLTPLEDQTIADPGAVTPPAAANLATANAALTAGASVRQKARARALGLEAEVEALLPTWVVQDGVVTMWVGPIAKLHPDTQARIPKQDPVGPQLRLLICVDHVGEARHYIGWISPRGAIS